MAINAFNEEALNERLLTRLGIQVHRRFRLVRLEAHRQLQVFDRIVLVVLNGQFDCVEFVDKDGHFVLQLELNI
jgi:hypothetical protein